MAYLLVGNYGVGNAGDEILRSYFLENFPEQTFLVLSESPRDNELPRLPAGLRSFLSLRWIRTMWVLYRSQGMVFGGGSLFTDIESVRACWIWFLHALFALIFRKPVYLAFQGIGPFRTRFGEALARFVVRHAVFISVRDSITQARLLGDRASCVRGEDCRAKLWKKNTKVVQTFDPSISLLDVTFHEKRTKKLFIFIPRFSTNWNVELRMHVVEILRGMARNGADVRILSFQPDDFREQELCDALSRDMGFPVMRATSIQDAVHAMQGATCVISERYHGLIAALMCGIPFLALMQGDGDKLDAFARMCSCPSVRISELSKILIEETDWDALQQKVSSLPDQYRMLVRQGERALLETLSK